MNNSDNVRGRIFDIQKYSIHDGPGIRTIVFLKGCALRCRWCCNPESQEFAVETMTVGNVRKTIGKDVSCAEVMTEVKKDIPYYRRSGGGMTLSGGEALLQPEFSLALLISCKSIGINTAIETSGFAKFEVIEKLLPFLDYILMDIKHMNDEKHKEFTGRSNRLILENAEKIAKTGANLTIRTPVIPGFNDTEAEIFAISDYAVKIGAKAHHLLPYHRMGEDKYTGLSRDYALKGVLPPKDEYMQRLLSSAAKTKIRCQIGG